MLMVSTIETGWSVGHALHSAIENRQKYTTFKEKNHWKKHILINTNFEICERKTQTQLISNSNNLNKIRRI